jgi:hypothetical protein
MTTVLTLDYKIKELKGCSFSWILIITGFGEHGSCSAHVGPENGGLHVHL